MPIVGLLQQGRIAVVNVEVEQDHLNGFLIASPSIRCQCHRVSEVIKCPIRL